MMELALNGDGRMTVKEVAGALKCDIHTVTNHANRLFPGKIQNGVKTYFDEKEVTLILESIKQTKGDGARSVTLKTRLQGIETNTSRVVRLAILAEKRLELEKQFNAELQAEIDELKTENAEQAETIALIADNAGFRQYKRTLRSECTTLIRKLVKNTGKGYSELWRAAYGRFFNMHNFSRTFENAFEKAENKIEFLARRDIRYLQDLKQAIITLFATGGAA
jgi:hypothetical protein